MLKNISLKSYYSFGIDIKADCPANIELEKQLLTIQNYQPNLKYNTLKYVLEQQNILFSRVKNIAKTVIQIRKSRLSYPKTLGYAGLFFIKSSMLTISKINNIYPYMPFYKLSDKQIKTCRLID